MLNADFGYQMQMTVDLTVEMLLAEKSSICDNGLDAPLMIEWGNSTPGNRHRQAREIKGLFVLLAGNDRQLEANWWGREQRVGREVRKITDALSAYIAEKSLAFAEKSSHNSRISCGVKA